jgi:hypothetical protein
MRLKASSESPKRSTGAEAGHMLGQVARAHVAGHDQTTWRKSDWRPLLSVSAPWSMTCKQDVEQIRVRLLDLVEQQHRMRRLVNGVGKQRPPWSKPT